ncbi:MAG: hypothetical protein O2921_11095 [Chloroflexi bacterium]|nr:hypothetical protein [Chloroflexota bacterium]
MFGIDQVPLFSGAQMQFIVGPAVNVTVKMNSGVTMLGRVQIYETYSFRDSRSERTGLLEIDTGLESLEPGDKLEISTAATNIGRFYVSGVNFRMHNAGSAAALVNITAEQHIVE